jgi:restriction system-associated AAA family ATPase
LKLLSLKITDLKGFRSLHCGFEHYFRSELDLQSELDNPEGFAPFVCAGPNGSGKSNLLEALAAIFFQLEVQRVRRSFLPDAFASDDNPNGIKDSDGTPNAFELEYLIMLPHGALPERERYAHVRVTKVSETSPQMHWLNPEKFAARSAGLASDGLCSEREREFLLPEYVLGYSSGENEILSLPFFKMRFVQFDEYWNCLKEQLPYLGRPETRLAYLDSEFSQAILLCNMLLQDDDALQPFREDVGIEALLEFRIVIRRNITVSSDVAKIFGNDHPALMRDETNEFRINLMHLLEADSKSADNFDPVVTRLKRCATCWYEDETTDTLVLDYWVNQETREAFRENFDYAFYKSPLALFQAFQVLLTLNLYAVAEGLKDDVYRSGSHYVSETVPRLASDQRIMRFKFVRFSTQDAAEPMMLKGLSDGEHQLLHSLGMSLLFRNTNSLFLLDEPETHFNPDWRANFISRLRQCLPDRANDNVGQEMLITTHSPFLISDSKPDKVLVFEKDKSTGEVRINPPRYNTLGASINKITMSIFGKRETIGGRAQEVLDGLRGRFEKGGEDKDVLINEIHHKLGDSVEKVLLIKAILDSYDSGNGEVQD